MTKQVIVMRKDLNMRKGKMVAQGSHASLKVFTDRMFMYDEAEEDTELTLKVSADELNWLQGSFAKVCVSCDSEEELDTLYNNAKAAGLPCAMIVDSGRTEFNGVPTKTCIAIGPAKIEDIDVITGHLKLL